MKTDRPVGLDSLVSLPRKVKYYIYGGRLGGGPWGEIRAAQCFFYRDIKRRKDWKTWKERFPRDISRRYTGAPLYLIGLFV